MTQNIFPFAMRGREHVGEDVYEECLEIDAHGVKVIEKVIGRAMLNLSWANIHSRVAPFGRSAELRFQVLYANWILGTKSGRDTLWYYDREKTRRISLLREWIEEHPDDAYLL